MGWGDTWAVQKKVKERAMVVRLGKGIGWPPEVLACGLACVASSLGYAPQTTARAQQLGR